MLDLTEEQSAELTAMAQKAAEALRTGDHAAAEELSLQVLTQAPLRPFALATLAEIRLDQRRMDAAAALLKRLTNLEPGNFWPINKLAMLEIDRGNLGEAEMHARTAVRVAPKNPQAHNLLGMG